MGSRDWSNLQVSEATKCFIKESGFARMTPVQAIAIPLILNRRDVAVEACTGSGKTLAFLIPSVEILLSSESPSTSSFNVGCLALAPTRELAMQIHEVLGSFIDAVAKQDQQNASKIGKLLLVGGSDVKACANTIQRADLPSQFQIVIATPGRLRSVMKLTGACLNFKTLEILVLDEADRLLEMGFSTDIQAILHSLPKQRRTGLFSATLTTELKSLMKTGMRNPVHVCVRRKAKEETPAEDGGDGEKTPAAPSSSTKHELPAKLKNFYTVMPAQKKLSFLLQFLRSQEVRKGKTIVFFVSCASVDFWHAVLRYHIDGAAYGARKKDKKNKNGNQQKGNQRVEKLHGQMEQKARTKAYEKFCQAPAEDGGILLATDLAARGIDVDNVEWIVQFDAPVDPNAFVHRVGRTARAGHAGRSLLMLLPSEESYVQFLRQRTITIDEMEHVPGSTGEIPKEQSASAVFHRTRKLLETDREVMLKGSKALVSFVRAYQEHQLSYVFPFKLLDMGALAMGFCVLRLPRMKEILGRKVKNFQQSSVHPLDVPFRDKKQEKLRQERLKKQQEEAENGGAAAERPEKVLERDEDGDVIEKEIEQEKRTRTQKRKAGRKGRADEWALLQAEERLAKKMRKGNISAAEFSAGVKKTTKRLNPGGDEDDSGGNDFGGSDDSDMDSSDSSGDGKKKKKGKTPMTAQEKKDAKWLTGRKRRRKKGRKR